LRIAARLVQVQPDPETVLPGALGGSAQSFDPFLDIVNVRTKQRSRRKLSQLDMNPHTVVTHSRHSLESFVGVSLRRIHRLVPIIARAVDAEDAWGDGVCGTFGVHECMIVSVTSADLP